MRPLSRLRRRPPPPLMRSTKETPTESEPKPEDTGEKATDEDQGRADAQGPTRIGGVGAVEGDEAAEAEEAAGGSRRPLSRPRRSSAATADEVDEKTQSPEDSEPKPEDTGEKTDEEEAEKSAATA